MKNLLTMFLCVFAIASCTVEAPEQENIEEIINRITLTFKPVDGGEDIVVKATDPDANGPRDIAFSGPILLKKNTEYLLIVKFENSIQNPPENVTDEVEEESDAHLLLFGWTGNVFSDPSNGDISNNRAAVRYQDEDVNGLPVGLETEWTTAASSATGTFRVVLKHQPDLKSATSGVNTGATDADVSFEITIEN